MALSIAAAAQNLKPAKDKATKLYGYQDKAKNWVIAPSFEDAKRFDDDGLALVKQNGLLGLINTEGSFILQPLYDGISKFDRHGLSELKIKQDKAKYYGLADRTGRLVLPVEYHKIIIPRSGACIMASRETEIEGMEPANLWGIYTIDGQEVFDPQFLSEPSYSDGTFVVKDPLTGLCGAVDMQENILLPFEYLAITQRSNGFRALGQDFVHTTFNADGRKAESFHYPGAVIAYDTMGDKVRAAAWGNACIGLKLYRNQVRSAEIMPGSYRKALCSDLQLDWRQSRFLRLEPCIADDNDPDAMYGPGDSKYTLKAILYEANGSFVEEVSSRGWLQAECSDGIIYNADGRETWFIFKDINAPFTPTFTLGLSGYRELMHDNIYNGFCLRSYDLEKMDNVRNLSDRCIEIIEKENIGITSYTPPATDYYEGRRAHEVMRAAGELFLHEFRMGDVLSCSMRSRGEDKELVLEKDLVCHFSDRFSDPYYSMSGDELIYWGLNGRRTVRLSLVPSREASALADDVAKTDRPWAISIDLYEEDGNWLRTLGIATGPDFYQEGVLVFKDLRIALLAPWARRDRYHQTVYKVTQAQPMPRKLSALRVFHSRPPRH